MKKYLLSLAAFLLGLSAQAEVLDCGNPQPEGKLVTYTLKAVDYYTGGMTEFTTSLVFSEDGTKVWFNSLNPSMVENAWHEGTIAGDSITISKDEVFMRYDYYGTGTAYELKIAELNYETYEVYDLVLLRDGDHIYFDNDPVNYSRPVAIYCLNYYDGYPEIPCVWSMSFCFDLTPAETGDVAQEIPEDATQSPYIYYMRDGEDYPVTIQGVVAQKGDNHYFTQLTDPEAVQLGTQQGDEVTVAGGQYLGISGGYKLYSSAIKADSTHTDLVLKYDAEKKIYTPANTVSTVALYNPDQVILDTRKVTRIEPYTGDVEATPKDPYDVKFAYYSEYDQYCFSFSLDNLDVNGRYLNPDRLGYEMYLDEDLYEFSPDVFDINSPLTLIPYGMVDNKEGGHEINWTAHGGRVWLTEDLFNIIGVRAVYTVDGETYTSNIISVDQNGGHYTNFQKDETGIENLETSKSRNLENSETYDLQGRRVMKPGHGLYIQNGKLRVRK